MGSGNDSTSVDDSSSDDDASDAEIDEAKSARASVRIQDCHARQYMRGKWQWFWTFAGIGAIAVLIMLALHVLLMKLTVIYFASMFNWHDWTWRECIAFLGFVNHLGGLGMSDENELLRVLIFKFAGEDSTWNEQEIEECDAYFQCLATEAMKQLGQVRGVGLLWTLSAEQLQRMLLGHQRAEQQDAVRHHEVSMWKCLDSKESLMHLRDKLIQGYRKDMEEFQAKTAKLPREQRLKRLNRIQRRAIGKLRLAAKVSEFIWQWEKDACGESLEK